MEIRLNRPSPKLTTLLFAALVLCFLPTLLWLGQAWWSDPYYSHGPLVLLIALYLAFVRHSTFCRLPAVPDRRGWPLLVLALVVHLWATVWHAYYVSALMIPIALLALLITLYGPRAARPFWFPLAFLLLMVPLPLAERVGPALGGWTAASATALAQWTGIAASHTGSQVNLPNSTFAVGIPCGGLRSIVTIITLSALLAYVLKGHLVARGLLPVAALPIVMAANTVRIVLVFAIANLFNAQIAMAYFHDWSSPVLFAGAFALVIALTRLLRCSGVRWQVVLPQ